MDEYRDFKVYALYSEITQEWYDVSFNDWTYDFSGSCIFPTYELAFDYLKEEGYRGCKVYHVDIPQNEKTFDFYPVHLPCNHE